MRNRIFIFLFALISFSIASAETWTLSLEKEMIKGRQKKSILYFKSSKGRSLRYNPIEEPFTFIKEKQVVVKKNTFFVTTWAYGARSVIIRVFDPNVGVTNPLCTALSDSYDPQVRFANHYLEVEQVTTELQAKPVVKWKKCISFSRN